MIAWLAYLGEGIAAIGTMIVAGIVGAVDLVTVAVIAAVSAAFALLPSMSDAPAIGTPTWLGWLNWFFPVGDLLAGLTTLVTMFVAFLVIRYLLRVVRAL